MPKRYDRTPRSAAVLARLDAAQSLRLQHHVLTRSRHGSSVFDQNRNTGKVAMGACSWFRVALFVLAFTNGATAQDMPSELTPVGKAVLQAEIRKEPAQIRHADPIEPGQVHGSK